MLKMSSHPSWLTFMLGLKGLGGVVIAAALLLSACASTAPAPAASPKDFDKAPLYLLFQEDQADRADNSKFRDPGYLAEMGRRDQQRREKVLEILAKKSDKSDYDFYLAAMIFNHSIEVKDAKLAYEFISAADLMQGGKAFARSKAVVWDRLMMRLGIKQWYGTQFVPNADGSYSLYQIDESAVTDEERKALGIKPPSEIRSDLEKKLLPFQR